MPDGSRGFRVRINADFSICALVVSAGSEWIRSPETGVDRIMLDRIGNEVARATSIVRYAAGSSFGRHEHAKGEEFLVLDGVFSDDQGDYLPGFYVRNPPGSNHSPYSREGCRILVKLRQFDPQDLEHVVIDTRDSSMWQPADGAELLPLHKFGSEQVFMLRVAAGHQHALAGNPGGTEIFVVSGSVEYQQEILMAESWLRLPAGRSIAILAKRDSVLWVKQGHLPPADV